MDLSKVLDTGATLIVRNPTLWNRFMATEDVDKVPALLNEDGSAVTITLAGTDSDRWRKAQDSISERSLKQATPQRGTPPQRSLAEVRDDQAIMYAHATIAWHGIDLDGVPLDCTFDNARKLYSRPECGWLIEQVDRFIGDRRNFWKASSPT